MSVPDWLHCVSAVSLIVAVVCALWVVFDIYHHPQHMRIMNVVWPITMLWAGPLGLWGYLTVGRVKMSHQRNHEQRSFRQRVALGASHCGSGCTLGDLIAETLTIAIPVTVLGSPVFATWIIDFILAFLIGIIFQYFSIKPMRELSPKQGLVAAVKADTLSLIAWQVGMYGWMAICLFAVFSQEALPKHEPAFWFMMQIAMLVGFCVSYPVNAWLIKRGIKEAM
ncbi:DUF4396 domain-containing protein [Pseudomonas luteola]|uniref:DUF4396 domain-containing protein n=1 Tax=Pseudomonas sp. JZ134 TaxID=2806615 RepID=UPI0038503B13